MQATNIFLLLIGIGLFGFYLVRGRSLAIANPLGGIPTTSFASFLLWHACSTLVCAASITYSWVLVDV